MKTALAALAAYSGCAAARRYLDRASSQERSFLEGRVRLKVLWNEGAAFGLPRRRPWGCCGPGGSGAPWGRA